MIMHKAAIDLQLSRKQTELIWRLQGCALLPQMPCCCKCNDQRPHWCTDEQYAQSKQAG